MKIVMKNKGVVLVLLGASVLSACSWVRLSDEAKSVKVIAQSEADTCKKVATTTANLMGKVLGMERRKEKVQVELETLARNAAADLGGNAILPVTSVDDGKQLFAVYQCP